MDEAALRREIVESARRMNALGINQGTSGNISARCGDHMLITPSATPYDDMRPEDVAAMPLDATARERSVSPTSPMICSGPRMVSIRCGRLENSLCGCGAHAVAKWISEACTGRRFNGTICCRSVGGAVLIHVQRAKALEIEFVIWPRGWCHYGLCRICLKECRG